MSNTTEAVWPYEKAIPSTHELINIFPGVDIVVDREFLTDADKVRADLREILLERGAITIDRPRQISSITERVTALALHGNMWGLQNVQEAIGWISNFTTHTAEDIAKGIIALLPTLTETDLLDAREAVDFQIRRAAEVAQ